MATRGAGGTEFQHIQEMEPKRQTPFTANKSGKGAQEHAARSLRGPGAAGGPDGRSAPSEKCVVKAEGERAKEEGSG